MNSDQARRLKKGSRVMWKNNPNDLGTVLNNNPWAVQIQWDNEPVIGWIHHNDMKDISIVEDK